MSPWREGCSRPGPWGHHLPSEAVPVLYDLPAGRQQYGRAEGGSQAAQQGPALPRVHLPHHGHAAWSPLCASPGGKVMGTPPLAPQGLPHWGQRRGRGRPNSTRFLSARAPPGGWAASPSEDRGATPSPSPQILPLRPGPGLCRLKLGAAW